MINDLNKVLPFFNYKGIILERIIGGYKWHSKKFTTLEEVDDYIKKVFENIKKSIL